MQLPDIRGDEGVPLFGEMGLCFPDHWYSFFFNFCLFILREREREKAGEGQRERGRESQAGSMLLAWSLTWGLNPQTMRS